MTGGYWLLAHLCIFVLLDRFRLMTSDARRPRDYQLDPCSGFVQSLKTC